MFNNNMLIKCFSLSEFHLISAKIHILFLINLNKRGIFWGKRTFILEIGCFGLQSATNKHKNPCLKNSCRSAVIANADEVSGLGEGVPGDVEPAIAR